MAMTEALAGVRRSPEPGRAHDLEAGRQTAAVRDQLRVRPDRLRRVRVSVTDDRAKVRNVRRDPRVSLFVSSDDGWSYAVLEGDAELSPVARDEHDATVEALVDAVPGRSAAPSTPTGTTTAAPWSRTSGWCSPSRSPTRTAPSPPPEPREPTARARVQARRATP